jgi:hypothetical protein
MQCVPRRYKQGQLAGDLEVCCCSDVVSCYSEKLVAEVAGRSGTQRKRNVRRWKPLPSNCSENVTVNIGACVQEWTV